MSELNKLQKELDKVYDELYQLKSNKTYLMNSHFELINDIESAINESINNYKEKEFDDMPVEEFLTIMKSFKRYINEYKKAYKL
jgi:hypothetical protein